MADLNIIEKVLEEKQDDILRISDEIWEYAELSHEETKSSTLLMDYLEKEGFTVERGVCGVDTAFIASYGSGKPVIALLGEYDALPNLSQRAGVTVPEAIVAGAPGHGCGHNLLGTGSLTGALIAKAYLEENHLSGTVRYYGCAAEEHAGVKPLMVRDGYFKDVDCAFGWHPSNYNGLTNYVHVGVKMDRFEFFGKTSHAGSSPELGRSALDACELMNIGVNYLREHVVPDARIHYAYQNSGGTACNIVPDYASLNYGMRALKMKDVLDIEKRIIRIAKGAAMMTDTEVKVTELFAYSDFFQNAGMGKIMSDAMVEIGAPKWDEEDYKLAHAYVSNYNEELTSVLTNTVHTKYPEEKWDEKIAYPLDDTLDEFNSDRIAYVSGGSTDVGDVAYAVPTAYLLIATRIMASPGHSWYQTSAGKSSIGHKALLTAGKVMGLSCMRVFDDPSIIEPAKEEWKKTVEQRTK